MSFWSISYVYSSRTGQHDRLMMMMIFAFLQHRPFSTESPANNPECFRPPSHDSQASPRDITPALKSLHWLNFKVPQRNHYKKLSLTYNALQTSKVLNLLTFTRYSSSNRPGLRDHHHIFVYAARGRGQN